MTEFAKGIAIGMIAGGTVGAIAAMPKKRMTTTGKLLKAAGHIIENLSDSIGF